MVTVSPTLKRMFQSVQSGKRNAAIRDPVKIWIEKLIENLRYGSQIHDPVILLI